MVEAWVGPSDPGNVVVMIANSGALTGMTPHPSSCGSVLVTESEVPRNAGLCDIFIQSEG